MDCAQRRGANAARVGRRPSDHAERRHGDLSCSRRRPRAAPAKSLVVSTAIELIASATAVSPFNRALSHDVANDEPARTQRLEAALDGFLHEQTSACARFRTAYERGVMPQPTPARELAEQLRSLGYVR